MQSNINQEIKTEHANTRVNTDDRGIGIDAKDDKIISDSEIVVGIKLAN